MEQSLHMAKLAKAALEDKKAQNVKIIDIRNVSVLADYFIIADGSNPNQVQAMADSVGRNPGKGRLCLPSNRRIRHRRMDPYGLRRYHCTRL